jgi:hypothetical protein
MKIAPTGTTGTSSVRRTNRPGKSGTDAFASHLSDSPEARESASVGGSRAAAGIDALLAAQEMGDALESGARARQRASDILDRLDELRHGLLMGSLTRGQIENLARLVRLKREQVTDPRLAEVLDQIELRAEVELAKYSTLD